jgi:hypothetical protein
MVRSAYSRVSNHETSFYDFTAPAVRPPTM